jgi:site-specific recombinase XerD
MKASKAFPALLEAFFTDRLMTQRRASEHTIASYRDTFRLLLRFIQQRFNKRPSHVALQDLGAPVICEFLNYLEEQRHNKARSRNARLAAIRSFFHYVAFEEPAHAELIQRVLAIPGKRWHHKLVDYLSGQEVKALLEAPDRQSPSACRYRLLLQLAVQTGLRVSELVGLKRQDVIFGQTGAHVHCHGKGRKDRCVPLAKPTAKLVTQWLQKQNGSPDDPLLPNARGGPLSRDGAAYILRKCVAVAAQTCPSVRTKRVSPHVLRHTNAVNLLQAGVDQAVIALWLGHESVETTQVYLHADVEYKEKILTKVSTTTAKSIRYRADDELLAFLNNL